jgi:CRISPR-associated protein Cmr6
LLDSTNAGLWLDKFIQGSEGEDQNKATLVEQVSRIRTPDVYGLAFRRWEGLMRAEVAAGTALVARAKVIGRLAIGRGESVLETSVRLHHTYGVPYIPGSALKGTAANFARNRLSPDDWGADTPGYKVVFGEQEEAGYVTFRDALLEPGTRRELDKRALHPDVLTPHHPDYYQASQNPSPPADWDSPVPVPFLSATGTYLIVLTAVPGCSEWLEKALAILKLALSVEGIGIGAKTSSGYGRFKFVA